MQEKVTQKTIALVVRTAKSDANVLKAAMKMYLNHQKQEAHRTHGKISVKKLVGEGAGVSSIEVTDGNIRSFERVAKKYREKNENYIKPIIVSDNKYDHYTRTYMPDNYEFTDFIVSGDTNVYLIHGEVGIGKSTFLNELYFETSLYLLKNECKILPIIFHMEDFREDNFSPKEWIQNQLREKYHFLNFEPAFFRPDICVVFFLDAINDIQYVDYNDLKNKLDTWRRFIESLFSHYINIKFIISSRYLECLSDFEIKNYTRLFIQPYNDTQISLFVNYKNCSESTKKQLLEVIKSNEELPFLKNPFFLNNVSSTKNP